MSQQPPTNPIPPEPIVPEIEPAHDPVEVPINEPAEHPPLPQPPMPEPPQSNPPIYVQARRLTAGKGEDLVAGRIMPI